MSKTKDEVRSVIDAINDFYTSPDGLGRTHPPLHWNDRAAADWIALALMDGESAESVLARIRTFPEYTNRHQGDPPPPAAAIAPLTTDGPIFRANGQPWRWKGVSAFALLDRFAKGQDITDFLTAYRGFNLLRVWPYVPAKDWGARAWDSPSADVVIAFLSHVAAAGFYVELTLLTDDDAGRIDPAKRLIAALAAARPSGLVLEAANEPITHKNIDTAALRGALAASGFLYSSGDYEDSNRFYGSFLTAHTGRDGEWPRRAHDLLEYYHGGGPNAPSDPAHKVPIVADEPIRPDQAGYNEADFRAYYGTCALLGAGGTLHTETGKFGLPPTAEEARIAAVVLEALNAFPADAPTGPYSRPVEKSLRTYAVGPWMTRVRPESPIYQGGGWTALEPSGVLWRKS